MTRPTRRRAPTRATAASAPASSSPAATPAQVLGQLPAGLRAELVQALQGILANYRQGRWGPSELDGGKLCEVAYTILLGYVGGAYPARANKPRNMATACRDLESVGAGFPRSVRVQIPRVLIALYEIRNNRGVGHAGGDVDPNHMDATVVVAMAKWVVAELVRLFHAVDTPTATAAVEALLDRELPVIWHVGPRVRVLAAKLTRRDQMLLRLYAATGSVPVADLLADIEHPQPAYFRRDVMRPAHADRLIEWDQVAGTVEISPLGVRYVEEHMSLVA